MKFIYLALPLALLLMAGCTNEETASPNQKVEETAPQEETVTETIDTQEEMEVAEPVSEEPDETEVPNVDSNSDLFSGYQLIDVDGGDLSGYREANVVVDIGFGEREYWAFTNEYGQLVRVVAEKNRSVR